jgi:hypothetical protein
VAIALLAAVPFDRFERGGATMGARLRGLTRRAFAPPAGAALAAAPGAAGAAPVRRGDPDVLLATLATQRAVVASRGAAMPGLVLAELRVALTGMPKAWRFAALALVPLGLFVPLAGARVGVAAVAWLWPLMLWSASGTREARFGTAALFASAPRPLGRQLLAQWLAAVLVTLALTLPLSLRLLAAGEPAAGVTGLAGTLLVPALALACGTLTGNARLFEALYLCVWYGGVLNRVPGLDVGGASIPAHAWGTALEFALATPVLLAVARFGRQRRLFG